MLDALIVDLTLNTVLKHCSYQYNAMGVLLLEIFPNLLFQIASSYNEYNYSIVLEKWFITATSTPVTVWHLT